MTYMDKLHTLYSDADFRRLGYDATTDRLKITIDVHHMTCTQAMRFINNTINLVQFPFELTVIHGYHRGNSILNMIRTGDLINQRIKNRYADPDNNGRTHFIIDGDQARLS